jgi:hypothetical protein
MTSSIYIYCITPYDENVAATTLGNPFDSHASPESAWSKSLCFASFSLFIQRTVVGHGEAMEPSISLLWYTINISGNSHASNTTLPLKRLSYLIPVAAATQTCLHVCCNSSHQLSAGDMRVINVYNIDGALLLNWEVAACAQPQWPDNDEKLRGTRQVQSQHSHPRLCLIS